MDPSLGAEMAGLMRERLAGADDTSVVLASAETKLSDSLAPVKDLSPQLGLAAGLLELLNSFLPRPLFTAGGVLHGELADGQGPGVSLWVEKDGRSDVATTFWRTDVLGPDGEKMNAAVHRLSRAASAWLLHRVVKDTDRPILLTENSRSYALMAAGREWHDADAADRAWALYFGALALDPENGGRC